MIVATWNVLHRVHAVNWETPAIGAWVDEAARIDAVTALVASWIDAGTDVVCLQEVSGDQLASLRRIAGAAVHAFAYARVPTYWRRQEPATLLAPEEHLVVLVRGGGGRIERGEAFATDPGKGVLAVALPDGVLVVCTHVSFDRRHARQLARLLEVTERAPGPVIVCGDFNADRDRCGARLGPGFLCAVPGDGALPTRPRSAPPESDESQDIDHVFVRGLDVVSTTVIDAAGRSDHNPVVVEVTPRA